VIGRFLEFIKYIPIAKFEEKKLQISEGPDYNS
jgi:hypothetical protein